MFYIFKANHILSDKSDFGGRNTSWDMTKQKEILYTVCIALEKTRWKSDAFCVTRYRKPETTMERWQQMLPICIPSLKMWQIHTVVERLYCKRPIQCLASSKILTPHPPPGGGHSRWMERGWGGQYFGRRQTQLCTLHM
jgi:hypothetical protein